MLEKYGRGSISLQSPVTYQNGTNAREVTHIDLPLFLFDIVALATNSISLLKRSSSHIQVLQQFCLLSGLPMVPVVLLPLRFYFLRHVPKVNLLNDDTYRLDSGTVIMSSFRQIEQGAH